MPDNEQLVLVEVEEEPEPECECPDLTNVRRPDPRCNWWNRGTEIECLACDTTHRWCEYGDHYVLYDEWNDYGRYGYCEPCADSYDEDNYESEDDDDSGNGDGQHEPRCEGCDQHRTIVAFDCDTERVYCEPCADAEQHTAHGWRLVRIPLAA